MLSLSKIIVPTDFSKESNEVIVYAAKIAEKTGAEIILLHIEEKNNPDQLSNAQRESEKAAREFLDAGLINPALPLRIISVHGKVVAQIVETAKQEKASLIIMHTDGVSGLGKFFKSGHATKTVKEAPCPVLTIRNQPEEVRFEKLLLPLDMTKDTSQKVERIIEWAKTFNSEIYLVSVSVFFEGLTHNLTELSRRLEAAASFIRQQGLKCTTEMMKHEGVAAAVIEYAREINPDLIVIMTGQETKMDKFFLGSRANRMVAQSPFPILSLKPR